MPAFEVTTAGFETPRLPEARARVVEIWKGTFGENAQTASDSPDGQIIDTFSLLLALCWEGIGGVWGRSFFRSADGTALDLLLDLFGKVRKAAEPTTAELVWYGTNATVVPQGSLAEVNDTEVQLGTDAIATLGDLDTAWVVEIDTVVNLQLYRITISAVQYDFTTDAAATLAEILAGLQTALQADYPDTVALETAEGVGLVVVLDTAAIGTPTVNANMTVHAAARIGATASEDGENDALAGSIDVVATPISGVAGVVNPADAIPGRLRETDAEFRVRHLLSLSSSGRATPEAIRAHLLNDVPDVTYARVVENDTNVEDAAGRPPHSFEAFVIGGTDQAVADSIFASKAAGIQTWGSTDVEVVDSVGESHTVSFSRPVELYLHLRVTITPGEGYPDTGTPLDTIEQALADFLTGEGEPVLGQDVYRVQLMGAITSAVPGIAAVVIETDTTPAPLDAPTFAAADVVVDEGEIAIADLTRITAQL
jgi:uncharacterized phage protein gp47/JayE